LLAFLLLLAAREAGATLTAAIPQAVFQAVAMVSAIEALQFFTISHAADPADLTGGWICAALGGLAGWLLLRHWPNLHHRPRLVLQGLLAVVALVVLAWKSVSLLMIQPGGAPSCGSWMPLVNNFHRPWNSLLGDYTTGFLQYMIVGGVLAVWFRAMHRRPRVGPILGAALSAAIVEMAYTFQVHGPIDTGQLLLALLAGATVIGLDRAFWEPRETTAAARV